MARMEHTGDGIWVKQCVRCGFNFKGIADTFDKAHEVLSKFFAHSETYDGLNSWCRSCKSAYSGNRNNDIQRDDLLKEQANKCFLCSKDIAFNLRTATIDHCHLTGKTRKVLCMGCNQRMAAIDDEEWLLKAVAYRDSFRCE